MPCKELEKLEAEDIALCARARQASLTDEEREKLQTEIVALVFKIRDHQASGHNGHPCPGEQLRNSPKTNGLSNGY
jgi:hypothetical protein